MPVGLHRSRLQPASHSTLPRWRRGRCRGIALAECLEQTGVQFSQGSNEGGAESMSRRFGRPKRTRRRGDAEQALGALENVRSRFGRTPSPKSKGGAYGKGVGLGISALVALILISLSVWLLRKRAREEETTP